MTQKTQEKTLKSIINIHTPNVLEATIVGLVLRNKDDFTLLKTRTVGNTGTKALYGAGPLAYEGTENSSKTVFAGINRSDLNRFILVYRGSAGVPQLESAIQEEQLSSIWADAAFSRLEAQAIIPMTKELDNDIFVVPAFSGSKLEKAEAILRQTAQLLSADKKYKPKAYYVESKKTLVLGSSTTTQLTIAIEKGQNDVSNLVFKVCWHSAAADNIFAAMMQSMEKKLDPPLAMSIVRLLAHTDSLPVLRAIEQLCQSYYDASVLLTKRERGKIVLNSKVSYAKGALNSILKNLVSLSEKDASQYATILKPFATRLVELAKVNEPAKKALVELKSSLEATILPTQPPEAKKKGGN